HELLAQVAAVARRPLQILESRGPAPDHPVSAACPETAYLNALSAASTATRPLRVKPRPPGRGSNLRPLELDGSITPPGEPSNVPPVPRRAHDRRLHAWIAPGRRAHAGDRAVPAPRRHRGGIDDQRPAATRLRPREEQQGPG